MLHSGAQGSDLHKTKITLLSGSPISLGTVASIAGEAAIDITASPNLMYRANSTAAGDWQVVGAAPRGGALPWPGLYKDSSGGMHAVSLVGVRSAEPAIAPARAVAELRLPAPRYADVGREFWPWLVVAAIALCLAGWAMRVR